MLALAHYESGLCDCGFHESLTVDKANVFTWEERHCVVCGGKAKWDRIRHAEDERIIKTFGENPSPRVTLPTDGRRTFTVMKRGAPAD